MTAIPAPTRDGVQLLVNIDVPDLPAAERFYTRALGLTPARRFGAGGVELRGAGVPVYLLAKPGDTVPIPGSTHRRDYARHWTPVHLDVAVADIELTARAVLAAGGSQEGPIQDHVWGRMALMADPFGHGLCLLQWKGRGYDEIADPPPDIESAG